MGSFFIPVIGWIPHNERSDDLLKPEGEDT